MDELEKTDDGPKKAIWVTEFEAEVLGGYLAEMLDETENGELVDYAREVISSVLIQLDEV